MPLQYRVQLLGNVSGFGFFFHNRNLEIILLLTEGFRLNLPIHAQKMWVSAWRCMLREPRMSTLSGKRLIYTLDLLVPWHLCSNYPKKRSQMNASVAMILVTKHLAPARILHSLLNKHCTPSPPPLAQKDIAFPLS